MARASDQFRQSDVTLWGIVALCCGGFALVTANISAIVPDSVFGALHATRLSAARVNEMHTELTSLEDEEARLLANNTELTTRLELGEHNANAIRQRVSALEVSVPQLTEAMNARSSIDRSVVTGSITADAADPSMLYPADGGSVRVTQTPLLPGSAMTPSAAGPKAHDNKPPLVTAMATPSPAAPATDVAPPAVTTASLPPSAAAVPTAASAAVIDALPGLQPMPAALPLVPTKPANGVAPVAPAAGGSPAPATASSGGAGPAAQQGSSLTAGTSAASGANTSTAAAAGLPTAMWATGLSAQDSSAGPGAAAPIPSRPWLRPDVITEGAIAPSDGNATASGASTAPTQTAAVEPPPATGNVTSIGVAIGAPVQPSDALVAWQALAAKVGILLVGTSPLLADDPAGSAGKVLVAGPLPSIANATALCANITRAGVTCMPMPYVGMAVTASPGPSAH